MRGLPLYVRRRSQSLFHGESHSHTPEPLPPRSLATRLTIAGAIAPQLNRDRTATSSEYRPSVSETAQIAGGLGRL
ncbi:MAG: hypothetical protein F6J97_24160 [Leptolyngbya sp. SIO4C1]|nr:hypothetical protein [Leptolyngbya sp. SIO4C1]